MARFVKVIWHVLSGKADYYRYMSSWAPASDAFMGEKNTIRELSGYSPENKVFSSETLKLRMYEKMTGGALTKV